MAHLIAEGRLEPVPLEEPDNFWIDRAERAQRLLAAADAVRDALLDDHWAIRPIFRQRRIGDPSELKETDR